MPTPVDLTITSNGVRPEDRQHARRIAGAHAVCASASNPMHGRDRKGAVASLTRLPSCRSPRQGWDLLPSPSCRRRLGKDELVRKNQPCGAAGRVLPPRNSHRGRAASERQRQNWECWMPLNTRKITEPDDPRFGYAVRFNALTRAAAGWIQRTFTVM